MKNTLRVACVLVVLGVGVAWQETAPNLLADPGFEQWAGDASSTNWATFGNAFCGSTTPRTKAFDVKLYGNFKNEVNNSGIYQDVPAQPGKRYEATAYLRRNPDDRLEGDNRAWVKLEYFDASRKEPVATFESLSRLDSKSPANKYVLVSTGPTLAPTNTAWARMVVIFRQGPDNASGAVFADDVSLKIVP